MPLFLIIASNFQLQSKYKNLKKTRPTNFKERERERKKEKERRGKRERRRERGE